MSSQPVQLAATITISGSQPPYTVEVPVVHNMRADANTVQPARITYTLASESAAAGFSLGDVVPKVDSADISLVSQSPTQYVFDDTDTVPVEHYSFGFYFLRSGDSYYFDPDIMNEEPH